MFYRVQVTIAGAAHSRMDSVSTTKACNHVAVKSKAPGPVMRALRC